MNVGDLVLGRNGFGRITHVYPDGTITVNFLYSAITMHGVPSTSFTLQTEESLSRYISEIKNQERIQDLRKQKEESRKEAERLRIIKKEQQRQLLLSKIRAIQEADFLEADRFYYENCTSIIPSEEYQREKIEFVQGWFNSRVSKSDNLPDKEQAAAIAATNGHLQVIARAGSGKTLTIVNRAFFLQKHCRVDPHEMLLLAFNKQAAEEMRKRLRVVIEGDIPHIMTFHALAYGLVHPEENLLYDDPRSENEGLSKTIQAVIDDHLRSKEFNKQIRDLMLAHFRKDWVRIIEGGYDKNREELLKYRRSLPRESLKGEDVKSYGEKIIADFLFEHDVSYLYEYNHWVGNINYRPDFTLFKDLKSGVVIEYFGLAGDPDYDKQSKEKRNYWKERPEWSFLEFTPVDIKQGGIEKFRNVLKATLENEGFECERLPEDEIWHRVEKRSIDRFTRANVNFIGKCRKLGITPSDLINLIGNYKTKSDVEERFISIAQRLYTAYLELLTETSGEDFDGLMQRAIKAVRDGKTIFERKDEKADLKALRYIFIDEYQDFSNLFHQLTEAIQAQNPHALCFCVGDNWQAINGFAGSDLKYFNNFKKYFPSSNILDISTNYRSKKAIVEIGNDLMLGHGRPAVAYEKSYGRVLLVDVNDFKPTPREKERHARYNLTPLLLRLAAKEISAGHQVALLSRTNGSLPWHVYYDNQQKEGRQGIKNYLAHLRKFLSKESRHHISIDTGHKYKGLQKHVVIVLDAVERRYPLIHPDWVFSQILGDDIEKIISEERRLFYVALTRAIETLIIITEEGKCSPFLSEMLGKSVMKRINWADYPPIREEMGRLIVKVNNQKHHEVKDLLKADGFQWQPHPEKAWAKSFPVKGFSVDTLKNTAWANSAKGVEVRVVDDHDQIVAHYKVDSKTWLCIYDKLDDIKSNH